MDGYGPVIVASPVHEDVVGARFGVWTNYRLPEDRSGWHPLIRRFYDYWRSIAPPGALPGRQHIAPEAIVALLPRVWLLDVYRDPLRFRYRLVGTLLVQSAQRELTGQWLDEAHPQSVTKPAIADRYRFVAEAGLPTWRRGPAAWGRDPEHHMIENCITPLAKDGRTVDMLFGCSVLFDIHGREI